MGYPCGFRALESWWCRHCTLKGCGSGGDWNSAAPSSLVVERASKPKPVGGECSTPSPQQTCAPWLGVFSSSSALRQGFCRAWGCLQRAKDLAPGTCVLCCDQAWGKLSQVRGLQTSREMRGAAAEVSCCSASMKSQSGGWACRLGFFRGKKQKGR